MVAGDGVLARVASCDRSFGQGTEYQRFGNSSSRGLEFWAREQQGIGVSGKGAAGD